jgi:hypothetical protein
VAVIFTVWSMGGDGGQLLAGVIAGTTTLTAAMVVIATKLLVAYMISVAIKLFVKEVGAEFAILLAIVAIAFGVITIAEAGGLEGAPWATTLLQLSTGLMQAANTVNMEELMGEAEDFLEMAEEQTKLLDTAKELLEGNTLLNPFVIFGESPDDYYNRTVHSGNIGVLSISAISSYVDISLTLPKLEDTLGGNEYGHVSI